MQSRPSLYAPRKGGFGVVVVILIIAAAVVGFFLYRGAVRQQDALESELPPLPPTTPTTPGITTPQVEGAPIVEIGAEDEMIQVPEGNKEIQGTISEGVMETRSLKEFTITGKNFSFSETEIRVKKGDFVRIQFKSIDGFHDWTVDAFDAKTDRISTGNSSSVGFVADKAGTFEFYCSVGTHRQMGMVGRLVVE